MVDPTTLTADEIHERLATRWDFSGPRPMPRPGAFTCICGSTEWHPRFWRMWSYDEAETVEEPPHRIADRCDVTMKCAWCGQIVDWGVPITREYYEKYMTGPTYVGWHRRAD